MPLAEFIGECKRRLMRAKQDRLNGAIAFDSAINTEISGDEGDIAASLSDQHTAITQRERILVELREIDDALGRIEAGTYGTCEETEEPIERDRLLALPWTRLSLAGAEIRESRRRKFA
ncbi:MAG: TraR/DksA family transcriptional regulator [Bdellovibrionales bacterium]|nr:TraR/DksA family transcriptional regulator [Bdellovibrionales bacterium]